MFVSVFRPARPGWCQCPLPCQCVCPCKFPWSCLCFFFVFKHIMFQDCTTLNTAFWPRDALLSEAAFVALMLTVSDPQPASYSWYQFHCCSWHVGVRDRVCVRISVRDSVWCVGVRGRVHVHVSVLVRVRVSVSVSEFASMYVCSTKSHHNGLLRCRLPICGICIPMQLSLPGCNHESIDHSLLYGKWASRLLSALPDLTD